MNRYITYTILPSVLLLNRNITVNLAKYQLVTKRNDKNRMLNYHFAKCSYSADFKKPCIFFYLCADF
jgi:hypothetical protein